MIDEESDLHNTYVFPISSVYFRFQILTCVCSECVEVMRG